ncbi:MAG: dihydrolipoyl dehydrogenase [Myxococcales bacterium]|nr:dihydrolipoyl dehydrogenase [Myxococcales bacterium]
MAEPVDVLVIGSGPGGYVAAIRASQHGLSTICVEKERLGGVCLNWGCIPSKALLRAAEHYWFLKHELEMFGLAADNPRHDYGKVIARSRKIADQSERGVQFLFKKFGVQQLKGSARITVAPTASAPGQVVVTGSSGEQTILARHIVVATGARAKVFPGMQIDGERVLTYREAIASPVQPEHVIVLGSGAIGCEFAYFYQCFGSAVTLVEGADRLTPLEDSEVSVQIEKSFRKMGMDVRTNALCTSVVRELPNTENGGKEGVLVTLKDGTLLRGSHCLVALGVVPNVEDIGLEALGVTLQKAKWIAHDSSFRTNLRGIYAIGDVSGPPALAHTAYMEAHVCVDRIKGLHSADVDYANMPAATYCNPQIASVGLTEDKLKADGKKVGVDYVVGKFPYSANGKARGVGASEGFVKVLIGKKYGEILGAHIIGHEASEMLANFVMARGAEVTAEHFLHTVHAHPTLGEMMVEAVAVALGKSTHI